MASVDAGNATGRVQAGTTAPGEVQALLLPADQRQSCAVVAVPDSAAGFSDAIGGGLLEEIHQGVHAGCAYCVYADEERAAKGLAPNSRARALAARLDWTDPERLDLFGDLLVVGAETPGRDTDVPLAVLGAAARAGIVRPRTP